MYTILVVMLFQISHINRKSAFAITNIKGHCMLSKMGIKYHLSPLVRKLTVCICENKGADQLRSNHEADQRLCFHYTVHLLFFLNPKFQASSLFLLLHRPVCVGPVRKPHCWFSHGVAHLLIYSLYHAD